MSTPFFRRYTVQTQEVERGEEDSKKKEFDVTRVVAENNYDNDEIDRRIVHEMIGEIFDGEKYMDETSESEQDDSTTNASGSQVAEEGGGDIEDKKQALLTIQSDENDQ